MLARYEKTPFIPIVITLVAGICWALLMLMFVLFWAKDFDWLQNVAIAFLSLVVLGCVVGLMWVYWIFRRT